MIHSCSGLRLLQNGHWRELFLLFWSLGDCVTHLATNLCKILHKVKTKAFSIRLLKLSVFMQYRQYFQDLLMPLTICLFRALTLFLFLSISVSSALFPSPSTPRFFLSAAFLRSWNCNRRTKWLANPFLPSLEPLTI